MSYGVISAIVMGFVSSWRTMTRFSYRCMFAMLLTGSIDTFAARLPPFVSRYTVSVSPGLKLTGEIEYAPVDELHDAVYDPAPSTLSRTTCVELSHTVLTVDPS